jgi:hypothetical protein
MQQRFMTFGLGLVAVCHRCTKDSCDAATGQCKYEQVAGCCRKDAECVDRNDLCLQGACQDGKCVYKPKKCDDGKKCTNDSCDPKTGQCKYEPIDCNDKNACTKDSCDEATGKCKYQKIKCDDGKK